MRFEDPVATDMAQQEVRMEELLRRQCEHLLVWLREADVERHFEVPTGLGDWTVGDLVAHLALGLGLACDVGAAPHDAELLSIGQYLAAYPPAADEIAAMTRRTRTDLSPDPLSALAEVGDRAWLAIAQYDEARILARRGAMDTSDYLTTRLIELVVHGDDLHRVLPVSSSPVIPQALRVASSALARAYYERTGLAHEEPDVLTWVRVACGRQPSMDPALPLL